jgi:hypothetical protein
MMLMTAKTTQDSKPAGIPTTLWEMLPQTRADDLALELMVITAETLSFFRVFFHREV